MYKNIIKRNLNKGNITTLQNNILKLGVIGIPCEYGQPKKGPANAPQAIRKGGLISKLNSIGNCDIKDYGDIILKQPVSTTQNPSVENMKMFDGFAKFSHEISNNVNQILKEGRICCSIGGDHSIAVGTVHGHLLAHDNLALLWIDAHADINTNHTSDTGNIHGMPVSMIMKDLKEYWKPLPGMEWLIKSISPKNIAYIGLRSVDLYERLILDKYGIATFGMRDIEKYGIDNVVQMALDKIDPRGDRSLHVSYDIDSLDPVEAPSTGTPVRGGITLREGIHIMETIQERGNLKALDLVEVNPLIGNEHDVARTVDAAIQIILATFSGQREGIRDVNINSIPTGKGNVLF